MRMAANVCIVGSGGREHALAWKLSQSEAVKQVFVAPGNAGTFSSSPTSKIRNVVFDVKNNEAVSAWCKSNNIDLVAVGPEDPLANGLANHLKADGIKCFGPSQKAAQIEASKEFAKLFMDQHEIPTARWKSFTNADNAKSHILSAPYEALVVKASGLAAGKGVIVTTSREEAAKAVDELKQDKGLASACDTIVVEELLEGEEISVLCFSDGTNIAVMPPAQDHKRLLDGDKGPNTGGMGAYCKCPQVTDEELEFITKKILQKAVNGMKKDGYPYVGVLYAGLMMTKNGPRVLEFNCRFGDPETQVILPLLESDLYEIMMNCVDGTLNQIDIKWNKHKFAVGIVVVSGGYPASYPKGKLITGLDSLKSNNYIVFHAGTKVQDDCETQCVTSGGRVLAVVAVEDTLQAAAKKAKDGAKIVNFEGAFYRKDIACRALQRIKHEGMTYKASGVDIESADKLVQRIKSLTKSTMRSGVCGGIGGFGGIFDLQAAGYQDPYLVSRGKDIGEKLKIAQECGNHDTIGIDLVATNVNDILSYGAEPLFFLDTFTCGKLDVNVADKVITGITEGCREANCALIGGETAEMPGMYPEGDYDLTGFARGAVEKSFLLTTDNVVDGDVVIGLQSSGLHCNGFDIIKKIIDKQDLKFSDRQSFTGDQTLGEFLLNPSKIYVKSLLPLMKKKQIKAAFHIAEGGLKNDLLNSLPKQLGISLDASKWRLHDVYNWISENANLTCDEILSIFNCGLGMVLIVSQAHGNAVLEALRISGKEAAQVGYVVPLIEGQERFHITNLKISSNKNLVQKKKVGVLISGSGTNLQSLIDYTQDPSTMSASEIVLVLSNVAEVEGLKRAERANIKTKVLSHKQYKSRVEFDRAVSKILKDHGVEIICLAGFMRILSKEFVELWQGKILNVHPAILPAFKGMDAHKQVLDMGARITGCTVHFVEPEVDAGAIIEQAAVRVEIGDTLKSLQERVKTLEHAIFPKALELLASGKVCRGTDSKLVWLEKDENQNNNFKVKCSTEFQQTIQDLIRSTDRSGLNMDLQGKCGIFDPRAADYTDPYLVSGTDGVGTKLKIAQSFNKHDTIGIDLVAMCVNDILTHGAEPLFFMECFVCGKLNPEVAVSVVSGIAEGCRQANCSLVGAEVAQMPDLYSDNSSISNFGDYDVVGYAEGAVQKNPDNKILPFSETIEDGDVVIGIPSSGLHSNGYSLVRKIIEIKNIDYKSPAPFDITQTLGKALLEPTKIYVKSVLPLMKKGLIKAAAHITGGGLTENIPRVLKKKHGVVLDASTWTVPSVLKWIESEGNLSEEEMLKTFNCGLGMVLVVEKSNEMEVLEDLKMRGENASAIGHVKSIGENETQVHIKNWKSSHPTIKTKKKVGVLISGSGTNLQALIDYTQNPRNQSAADIVLVLSNVASATGLDRAKRAGINTQVLNHKEFKSRVEFDMAVHKILQDSGVEIICLAGFMRILSKEFVQLWQGKILNVHPALLPAFKGMDAHKQVLDLGARITGCTVHFVEPEVDAGAIIEQAAVRVEFGDTIQSLQERVKILEHTIFPKALELLASGKVCRGTDSKLIWC